MTRLLDVNVLIALTWPNHVHHGAAKSWFGGVRRNGWATCPLTEAGFVRVSCNPAAVRQSPTATDAIALLSRLRRLESHAFWAMEHSVTALAPGILSRIQGYRQIADAVLLDLAARHNGRLATFDTGMANLLAETERHWVETIPV